MLLTYLIHILNTYTMAFRQDHIHRTKKHTHNMHKYARIFAHRRSFFYKFTSRLRGGGELCLCVHTYISTIEKHFQKEIFCKAYTSRFIYYTCLKSVFIHDVFIRYFVFIRQISKMYVSCSRRH